jgi:sec-independent protein translocase protein TatA
MGNLGAPELILIVLVILIFFGAKKIPEIAQGLGKGIREFRKASRDIQDEIEKEIKISPEAALSSAKSTCYYCQSSISSNARFCPSCGKSLEAPKCQKCGTSNALGTKFCSQCGEKISA